MLHEAAGTGRVIIGVSARCGARLTDKQTITGKLKHALIGAGAAILPGRSKCGGRGPNSPADPQRTSVSQPDLTPLRKSDRSGEGQGSPSRADELARLKQQLVG